MPASYALESLGRPVAYIESSELLHAGSEMLRSSDVAILVSRSGDSIEVASLFPEMHHHGVKTIGVTNEPVSTLAQLADITILVNSEPDEMVAIQTYTGTSLILLMLAELFAGRSVEEIRCDIERATKLLSSHLSVAMVVKHSWQDFLKEASPLYPARPRNGAGLCYRGSIALP